MRNLKFFVLTPVIEPRPATHNTHDLTSHSDVKYGDLPNHYPSHVSRGFLNRNPGMNGIILHWCSKLIFLNYITCQFVKNTYPWSWLRMHRLILLIEQRSTAIDRSYSGNVTREDFGYGNPGTNIITSKLISLSPLCK